MRIFRRSVLNLANQFPMAKDDPDYATKTRRQSSCACQGCRSIRGTITAKDAATVSVGDVEQIDNRARKANLAKGPLKKGASRTGTLI